MVTSIFFHYLESLSLLITQFASSHFSYPNIFYMNNGLILRISDWQERLFVSVIKEIMILNNVQLHIGMIADFNN